MSSSPSQSRGPPTCRSKSSIDLKQLCALKTFYSYLGGAVAVKNRLFAVKHGSAYVLGCAREPPAPLVHQPSALSLALLRGKTKG